MMVIKKCPKCWIDSQGEVERCGDLSHPSLLCYECQRDELRDQLNLAEAANAELEAELEQVKADMELKGYSLTYKAQAAEIERLMDGLLKVMKLLSTIRKVACGEEQIDSDGSYSDTDALQWIYERINDLEQALKGKNDE